MIENYPTDSPEALAAIRRPGQKNVWIHGSITRIYTGEDYTPPPPVQPAETPPA